MKFTFKTHKATGPYRSFHSDFHEIKLKRKVVGNIADEFPHRIRLMIIKEDINEDGNPNCSWKWIMLSKTFNTIDEAKKFINNCFDVIQEKYNLRMSD